jgi:hypothetical protein
MLMIFAAFVAGFLGGAGWLLVKIIRRRWHKAVTIPRIARRACVRIDQEYEELVRTTHRRPR